MLTAEKAIVEAYISQALLHSQCTLPFTNYAANADCMDELASRLMLEAMDLRLSHGQAQEDSLT